MEDSDWPCYCPIHPRGCPVLGYMPTFTVAAVYSDSPTRTSWEGRSGSTKKGIAAEIIARLLQYMHVTCSVSFQGVPPHFPRGTPSQRLLVPRECTLSSLGGWSALGFLLGTFSNSVSPGRPALSPKRCPLKLV